VLGILADLVRANRVLAERSLHRIRKIELQLGVSPDSLAAQERDLEEQASAESKAGSTA
jgi:hypothetical protein